MPQLGISRVTDITRLDFLGLPVFASIRPRGLVHRVHAGKGLVPLDAETGALMEAVEYAAAEPQRTAWTRRRMSVRDLAAQFPSGVQWVDFAPVLGQRLSPGDVVTAVACERLGGRDRCWLPAELVFLPWEPSDEPRTFGWSSTGLASGNTIAEATLHGLLEVLERDVVSMQRARDSSRWVDPESLPVPFRERVRTWRARGVRLAVRELPNAFGLPCFEACLHQPEEHAVHLAGGYGLHLERELALARAISEAAQSRLSHIHGGREDITRFYDRQAGRSPAEVATREAQLLDRLFATGQAVALPDVAERPARSARLSEVLDELLQHLAAVGFPVVLRHRYALDLGGLQVVKVIVPRCEQHEPHNRRLGPRLLAAVTGSG